MIFVKTLQEDTMFLFLSETDLQHLRQGHTRFVNEEMLENHKFGHIILAYGKTDAETVKMLESKIGRPVPDLTKGTCLGCNGVIEESSLFEGQCIVCWATQAKRAKLRLN